VCWVCKRLHVHATGLLYVSVTSPEQHQNKVRAGCYLLQRFGKMLRKVYKALSAADADPYLTGLCRHHVAPLCVEVGQHLRELQSSHQLLRNALQDAIVPAFWGVLQRAFNVHLELRCMKHNRQVRSCTNL
jgi:hypothetical protein